MANQGQSADRGLEGLTAAAKSAAGSATIVRVAQEEAESDDPARGILRRLVHRDEPLTGGAGI